MKGVIALAAAWVFMYAPLAYGQDDSLRYIRGLPQHGDDTVQQVPEPDYQPRDNFVEIANEQLPPAVYKTLEEGPQYHGWQDAPLMLDKNTGLYWIHFTDDSTTRSYGFNKNGDPVSVRERTKTEE